MKNKTNKPINTNNSVKYLQDSETKLVDFNSRFTEDCIEFVSREDERECFTSLGLSFGKNYDE